MDTIYYTEFTGQKIFASAAVNLFFDRLFTTLANAVGQEKLLATVCLDGDVALALQKVTRQPTTIDVAVSDYKVLYYVIQFVRGLDVSSIKHEDYYTLIYVSGYPIRFYKGAWPTVVINNIPVRDLNSFSL